MCATAHSLFCFFSQWHTHTRPERWPSTSDQHTDGPSFSVNRPSNVGSSPNDDAGNQPESPRSTPLAHPSSPASPVLPASSSRAEHLLGPLSLQAASVPSNHTTPSTSHARGTPSPSTTSTTLGTSPCTRRVPPIRSATRVWTRAPRRAWARAHQKTRSITLWNTRAHLRARSRLSPRHRCYRLQSRRRPPRSRIDTRSRLCREIWRRASAPRAEPISL